MKKWILALVAALVLCGYLSAQAEGVCAAVIDGRNSSRVHLREAETAKSDSLGLFFTGTEVECLSDPQEEWTHVELGRLRGYIKSSYLRTGSRARSVDAYSWRGVVRAKNYINMRKGPSTEYQLAGRLDAGTEVVILGQTVENWYYVEADGQTGYVSAKLIELTSSEQTLKTGRKNTADAWKAAYRNFLLSDENPEHIAAYGLVFIDDDDVPELVSDTGSEAGGYQIRTWHNGEMAMLQTRRRCFSYIEREGLAANSGGHMGVYYDYIYRLEDGRWHKVAYGDYMSDIPEWDEETQRYLCDTYLWDGVQIPREAYEIALASVYDYARSVDVECPFSLEEILDILKS
ncbi:MAG: SH3 domain-containing protein [Clostridia bacterium]|nr:SH3 domain-containing protein [Clostridia bacterium]